MYYNYVYTMAYNKILQIKCLRNSMRYLYKFGFTNCISMYQEFL